MIDIVDYIDTYTHRASGWVQDSSNFSNLHQFVSAFSSNSSFHSELKTKIQNLVEASLARKFLEILDQNPIIIKYQDIVGTAPVGSRRSNTHCNGIGQAALTGQTRDFQGDWSTNNFLRWAESLQLVVFDPLTDTYTITKVGETYANSDIANQYAILRQQLMMYPPAIRILRLLNESSQTKYSLGEQLGFVGEKGFTSITEALFVDMYFSIDAPGEKKKLEINYEGSSDKYSRQICSWLIELGLVSKEKKIFRANSDELRLNSYIITANGKDFLRKASIVKKRFVPFGMLSMESSNRDHICKRRALLLKALSEKHVKAKTIIDFFKHHDISISAFEINDDIQSLINMGLNITIASDGSFLLANTIIGLNIPRITTVPTQSLVFEIKERLRSELKYIDHNLLVLLDFAYGSKKTSRLFEAYTAKVYQKIYPDTYLLGGASKPDVVVCTNDYINIIDTKAYSGKFTLPIAERDKMVRYINEYRQSSGNWHSIVRQAAKSNVIVYQFVSSKFSDVNDKLDDIARRTNVNGTAITAENLLRLIDQCLAEGSTIGIKKISTNQEVTL